MRAWKKVAEGIWEAEVPRFPHDKKEKAKPEFAILRLSDARYEEFKKNRKDFLNDYKIFRKKVRTQESCTEAKTPGGKVNHWYIVFRHYPTSAAFCHVYPGGSEPAN